METPKDPHTRFIHIEITVKNTMNVHTIGIIEYQIELLLLHRCLQFSAIN